MRNIRLTKIYKLLIIIILFLIYIINYYGIYANTTGTVYLDSNNDIIDIDEEVEISINISNFKTSAYTAYLYFDDSKFEFISGPDNINVDENRIIYVWYDEQGGNGAKTEKLENFVFKAKEKGLATFNIEGDFYTEKGQEVGVEFKEKQVQIGKEETILEKQAKEEVGINKDSNNSNLQNLRLNIEGIVPEFETDIYNYYLTVNSDVEDIEVLATAENSESEVKITGDDKLENGLNQIIVQVISPDKKSNSSYLINVTKTDDLESANTNLETLAIEDILLYPAFDTNVTNYTAEVSNSLENINLLAIPENESAEVEIIKEDVLQEGNNQIKIIVTASNGYTTREYNINVYKRNSEEETEYQKEQQENQNKLNEIYEVLKTSNNQSEETQTQEEINENEGEENRNRIVAFMIFISIVIIFASLSILFKKRKNKK